METKFPPAYSGVRAQGFCFLTATDSIDPVAQLPSPKYLWFGVFGRSFFKWKKHIFQASGLNGFIHPVDIYRFLDNRAPAMDKALVFLGRDPQRDSDKAQRDRKGSVSLKDTLAVLGSSGMASQLPGSSAAWPGPSYGFIH